MSLLSSASPKEALTHVFENVLDLGDDHEVQLALDHYSGKPTCTDITMLLRASHADLWELESTPKAKAKLAPLPRGLTVLVDAFQHMHYNYKRDLNKKDMGLDFKVIVKELFQDCKASLQQQQINAVPVCPLPTSARPPDPLLDFKKGAHCDPSACGTLKDIKQWDTWKHAFVANIEAQGAQSAINITCLPRAPDDITLHGKQQKCI